MDGILLGMITFLVIVNLFAMVFTSVAFLETYNVEYLFRYILIASILDGAIFITNVLLVATLDKSNQNGLSLLLQVGILVACILLIKLFDKVDYKRNVKPYLRIKF